MINSPHPLLCKEGSAHDLDSYILKNFSVLEHEILYNRAKDEKPYF